MRLGVARRTSVIVAVGALLAPLAASTPAAAAETTFAPAADTYVSSDAAATNYGLAGEVYVDGSPVKRTFLRFAVSGLTEPVVGARLRLHVKDALNAESSSGGRLAGMTSTSWSETAVTWNAQPAIDGPALGTLGAVARNGWYEFDVTSAVAGNGAVSFALTSTNGDGAYYDSREAGTTAPQLLITTGVATGDPVLVGAGDIALCDLIAGAEATATLLDGIQGTVFAAGDNAYLNGSAEDFANCYHPTWGRHKARTKPVPGNHEYQTPGASGYFGYFGAAAGDPAKGYYSYDLGAWHIVALNSNCAEIGGCQAGSVQEQWLRADLAASATSCTLAYWHHPLFTSGANHGPATETRPLFQALYDAGSEVVVGGHNHQYERFAPQNPAGGLDTALGIRQFVAGMGGVSHYGFGTIRPNSEARNSDAFGVLKFTLRAGTYDWQFVPEAGKTYTDAGTGTCH
jgi:hypothetical protein